MYIRRKVFSVGIDESGNERLFSTTEFVDEENYTKLFTSIKELAEKAADGDKDAEKKLRRKLGNRVANTGGIVAAVPSAALGGALARNSDKLISHVGGKNKATVVGSLVGTGAGLISGSLASQKMAKLAAKEEADQLIQAAKKKKQ